MQPIVSQQGKETNRHQLNFNILEKQIEKDLDKKIIEYFNNNTDLTLERINVFHINSKLKRGLRTIRYNKSNGFTLLYFSFINAAPLFQVAICSEKDTYSRLTGRVTVKEKTLEKLVNNGVDSLLSYSLENNKYALPTYRYFANEYIRNHLIKYKTTTSSNSLPLVSMPEEKLLTLAILKLTKMFRKEFNDTALEIDPESIVVNTQHIRYFEERLSPYKLGTVTFFKTIDNCEGTISSTGGITLQTIKFKISGTDKQFLSLTWARCSVEDVYSKEYGRKQALYNVYNGNTNILNYNVHEQSSKEFNQQCIQYLEKAINYPINFDTNTTAAVESE